MTILGINDVLGVGAAYNVYGAWRGRVKRPGPSAVTDRYKAAGFTAYFVGADTIGGESDAVYGMISTDRDGVTWTQVMRVMGVMGATQGLVWTSDASASDLALWASGASAGELGTAIATGLGDAATAATDITDFVSVIVRNWPIALAVVVVGYMLFTGKLRI